LIFTQGSIKTHEVELRKWGEALQDLSNSVSIRTQCIAQLSQLILLQESLRPQDLTQALRCLSFVKRSDPFPSPSSSCNELALKLLKNASWKE